MSLFPESQTGIWLNTPIKLIDTRLKEKLSVAQNDSDWDLSSFNDENYPDSADSELDSFFQHRAVPGRRSLPGEYARFHHNPSRTLYAHVKFNVVTEIAGKLYDEAIREKPGFTIRALDLGCSLQLLRRYFKKYIPRFEYTGVDQVAATYPDLRSDLTHIESAKTFEDLEPNTIFALDVLPELHSSEADLSQTLERWGDACRQSDPMFFFTIPQSSASESDKLDLEFDQWKALIEQHFDIEEIRGLGFLSALPYWLGKKSEHKRPGLKSRLLNLLKEPMYESHVLKAIDLLATKAFGRIASLRKYSHSVLVTARVKTVAR